MPRKLNFIDLFAGLGGFHFALSKLEHKCVFASEIQPELRELYQINHKMACHGDINKIDIKTEIPNHDIICAGFPCQPFSQAGFQYGFEDEERGNFFYKIMEIIDFHKPEFVFLENVPNLQSHDNGKTFHIIYETLSNNYDVKYEVLSPHYFGIPHHRTRIYIVGRRKTSGGLEYFEFQIIPKKECDIKSIIIEEIRILTTKEITRQI